jgi:ubiquinone biosynthesis protein
MADYTRKRESEPEKARLWLLENGIERKELGKRLLDSLMRQIFEDNLYHGDLAPGHIVLFRDSQIGFVDFGSCTFTEVEYLNRFRLFVRSLANRDYAKAADLCFLLCAYLPPIDMEAVKDEVIQCLRAWAVRTNVPELEYGQKSLNNATVEVVRVLWRHRCAMSWTFMRIRQALTTLDESLAELMPEINYTDYLARYFRKADRRGLKEFINRNPIEQVLTATATTLQIQDRINEYTMFQGSLIRRHAQVFQGRTNKVAFVLATLAGQVGVFMLILFGVMMIAFLGQHNPTWLLAHAGRDALAVGRLVPRLDQWTWVLALLLDVYLLKGFWTLKARLGQAEVRGSEE